MNLNEVIKWPILSEKTYTQMSKQVYTFAVDKRTNKAEVKKVVEFIFEVKVKKVNIFNVGRKPKKLGRFAGFKAGYKKAIIKLADGEINIFPSDSKTKAPEAIIEDAAKETKKPSAKPKISEAEKKAAAKIAKKTEEKLAQKAKEADAKGESNTTIDDKSKIDKK